MTTRHCRSSKPAARRCAHPQEPHRPARPRAPPASPGGPAGGRVRSCPHSRRAPPASPGTGPRPRDEPRRCGQRCLRRLGAGAAPPTLGPREVRGSPGRGRRRPAAGPGRGARFRWPGGTGLHAPGPACRSARRPPGGGVPLPLSAGGPGIPPSLLLQGWGGCVSPFGDRGAQGTVSPCEGKPEGRQRAQLLAKCRLMRLSFFLSFFMPCQDQTPAEVVSSSTWRGEGDAEVRAAQGRGAP